MTEGHVALMVLHAMPHTPKRSNCCFRCRMLRRLAIGTVNRLILQDPTLPAQSFHRLLWKSSASITNNPSPEPVGTVSPGSSKPPAKCFTVQWWPKKAGKGVAVADTQARVLATIFSPTPTGFHSQCHRVQNQTPMIRAPIYLSI